MSNQNKVVFANYPEKRFEHIREIGINNNLWTVYVIELKSSVKSSKSEPSYPNKIFGATEKHDRNSRLFYVGKTFHSSEERFHLARYNHMEKKTGVVRKPRLIRDEYPYTDSLSSLRELTSLYGFENPNLENRSASSRFEHYVAWALYKCGHMTWGPKISELGSVYQNLEWLGEEPYH